MSSRSSPTSPAVAAAVDEAAHFLVPQHRDPLVGEQALLQDALGAQRVAAMDQGDVGRMVGQVQRLLDRGIAAADHRDLLAAIEESVAGRTGADALALQRLLAVEAQPLRLRAGRDHQHLALVHVAAVAGQAERAARHIDADDRVVHQARADVRGLRLHLVHQPRTLDDVAKAGIVLDIGRRHQLAAGLDALHDDRCHPGARAIDRGGQSGRAGTQDQHLRMVDGGHACFRFWFGFM